jgi:Na+-transporting methylmalonyl-CoA/oxaloacetate decarboxylase gamma subunit
MDLSKISIDFSQITGDHVALAIAGMLVVFMGLGIVSLFITFLPVMLGEKKKEEPKAALPASNTNVEDKKKEEDDQDMMVAIAIALYLEQSNVEKITWDRRSEASPWQHSGRNRCLGMNDVSMRRL